MKGLETNLCFISSEVFEVVLIMNLYRISFQKCEKVDYETARLQNLYKLLTVNHKRVLQDIDYLLISCLLVLEK